MITPENKEAIRESSFRIIRHAVALHRLSVSGDTEQLSQTTVSIGDEYAELLSILQPDLFQEPTTNQKLLL